MSLPLGYWCGRCGTVFEPGNYHVCWDFLDWPDTLAANLAAIGYCERAFYAGVLYGESNCGSPEDMYRSWGPGCGRQAP